jgi:diguanylate cyclase (GGDEF)-like protein
MANGFLLPEGMEAAAPDDPVDLQASQQSPAELGGGVFDGARIAALHDLGLLDTEAEEDFDRYTRLATDLLRVPVSLVSLVDADRQFFKSQTGLTGDVAEALQTPLSHSFCQYPVASHQPLIVSDAREHPLVAENLAIRDLGVIAYVGMPLVLSDGHAVGAFCVSDCKPRDWSEQDIKIMGDLAAAVTTHLNLRKALAEQGMHDRLTGLPNRVLLCAQADQLFELAGPAGAGSVAAVCMGLDSFGLINDAYGARCGDRVLQEVGERLAAQVRGGDAFGRLGGDVFAIVGTQMGDEGAAIRLAGRLRDAVFATPFDVAGHSVAVTATVGLAAGTPGNSGADLLSRADDTARRSKASGGAPRMTACGSGELAAAQLRLRTALSGALDRGEIHVAYQPIIDLDSGATIGFEALARWTSPELGTVAPADFVPVAERTGDIVKVGEWVLRTACSQLARWRRDEPQLSVSVNLAPIQLELANLAHVVESALTEHGLPASALVLELTEGVLIGAGALVSRNLHRVRELGVRICLDDFGTGYSALGYLKRFPIDQLKIDRSFVAPLESDPKNAALVQAILTLARGFELEVVAEGIETPGQRQILEQLGCPLGQGYLFAPPGPPAKRSPSPHTGTHTSAARHRRP